MCRADPQRASSGGCPAKMAWRSRNATVSGHGLLKPQRIVAGDMPIDAADPNFKGKGIAAYANDMPIVWHT